LILLYDELICWPTETLFNRYIPGLLSPGVKRLLCCSDHSPGNRCFSDASSGISRKIWHIYVNLGLAAKVQFSVKDVFGVQSMNKLSYLSAEV
jgi:hypothetical protein